MAAANLNFSLPVSKSSLPNNSSEFLKSHKGIPLNSLWFGSGSEKIGFEDNFAPISRHWKVKVFTAYTVILE
jgi:hypothetical protein